MHPKKVLLSFCVLGLSLWVMIKLIHFNGLYGQDAHEYLRYAKDLHAHFLTAVPAPYSPPLYPLLGALLGFMMGINDALQLISVFSFVMTLWILFEIIRLIFPSSQYPYAFLMLFGFLSPYFMRVSICVMSDSLACLLLTCTLFYAILFFQQMRIRYFLALLFFAGLCVLTRFAAVVPICVMVMILLGLTLHKGNMKILYKMIGVLVIYTCFVLYFGSIILSRGFNHPLLNGQSVYNLFHSSFSTADGAMTYPTPNVCYILFPFIHPGFIMIGIILLFFSRSEVLYKGEIILCALHAIVYLIFIGTLPVQNVRFEILVFPFVLIMYQPAFDRFMAKVKQKTLLSITMTICQLPLIILSMKTILQINRVELQVATYLKPLQEKYHYIYELGSSGAIHSYDINITPLSLYGETVASLKDSSLLLLQTEVFEKQWNGKLPERNLEFIKSHAALERLKTFDDKWNLYVVHLR